MKKILKIVLPLFIVGLFLSVSMTRGAYGVIVGDEFTFDIVSANQVITVGTNSGSGDGYVVDGLSFAEGTSVDTNVTAVGASVDYNLTAGSAVEPMSSSGFGLALLTALHIVFPMLYLEQFAEFDAWNQTAADMEPGIFFVPFVESDTNWTVYIEMATDIHATATTNATQPVLLDAAYTDETDVFYFEMYFGGNMVSNFTTATGFYELDVEIEHHYQFAYTKSTGVMLGMRVAFDITGTSNSTDVDISFDSKVEIDGYNLPAYSIGGGWTWPFPAFGIIAAFTTLGTIAVLVIKRRK
ncbi:MAG: choice-of-anchor S family protein [Candidatus Heimdallarchaeota archaeon]